MEKFIAGLTSHWRKAFSFLFILVIFVAPGTRKILGGLVQAGTTQANDANTNKGSSANYSSVSSPKPPPVVSPVKPPSKCSTGHQHNQSHHNHHRSTHPHYYH
jgi:hypothetical protein